MNPDPDRCRCSLCTSGTGTGSGGVWSSIFTAVEDAWVPSDMEMIVNGD
jgi:hypothetical protein